MKVDSGLIVISIPITTSKSLHFFDLAVQAFTQGIGYPVSGIGYDIVNMRFQAFRRLDDRLQSGVRGPEIPAREVFSHPSCFMIVPEVTEVVLDSSGTTYFEIQ